MSINATQLKAELGAYARTNNKEIRSMAYGKSVTAKFMRTVPSVKGKFPALQAITGHVVQAFSAVWTPLGVTKFKVNELKNYRQKVNYPLRPDDIQAGWLAHLYEENKKPQDMPISKYIINDQLMPKVVEDREVLLCRGVYDATKPQEFGKSMDGVEEIIRQGLQANSANPVFQIPMEAITVANITDQVTEFELALPEVLKPLLKRIFMSTSNLERYRLDYFKKYGAYPSYTENKGYTTILGNRELIGLPGLAGSDLIFSTPDENFLRLIDLNDEPVITDVQAQDYDVKIFMEWWEGVQFWTNQMVVAGVIGGNVTGLAPAGANEEYYGQPALVAQP
ncbi:hypothetical protein [Hymenobacter sp. BT491]|uniref:hypothetical protein n=1 Tax=Hymenobacter sp. BT491 TaxID=2766779 RepID=UPI001653484B|nr:hypothetical protein [Hymenobacter sp. BT491]MBC6988559.1 hypothetical protein [Hymenobacter sp. BT491]